MAIPDDLLAILRCPACRQVIRLDGDGLLCTNAECRRRYTIDDDIPILLIDEAQVLSPDEWRARTAE